VRPGLAADLLAEVTQDRYTMYVFRGEIQQHQDIVGQSGAARELVRCGMTLGSPGAGWIDSVFKTRIPLVERVAGPRGAAALVRMLSAWNEEWGASAGRRLAVPRIGRRVRHAFASDLQPAVDLVGVLTAIGLPEQALRLCGDLLSAGAADVVEKLPLRDGSRLLDVLGFLDSPLTPRVARALREALDTRIRQPVWWDAKAQLVDVGRAARAVGALSVPVVPPGEPPVPPNVVHAAVLVWAATGLGRPGWGNDALDRAGQRLAQGDLVLDDTDRACLLAAAGPDSGVSLPADATDWSVGRAPLWLLRHLYVRAADTAVLAPVLEREGPALLERVRRPAARADWDAYRLRLALEARGVTVPTAAARPGPGGTRP